MVVIERDGKKYEFTEEEIVQAFASILNRQVETASDTKDQQEKTERDKQFVAEERKWARYQDTTAKKLPYPQNLLLGRVLRRLEGNKFLEGDEEYKKEVLQGFLWAISTLPEERRLALEYWFRDRKKRKECASLLNCTVSQFDLIRQKGIRHLKYIRSRNGEKWRKEKEL